MKTLFLFVFLVFVDTVSFCQKNAILFRRQDEPKEKAFSLLVPKGWIIEGGAMRLLDPNIAGASNMVDCKFDLAIKKDAEGSVMIRWLPEMMCIDQSQAFGNPEGAIFNNTLVRRKRDPVSFLLQAAIPYAHPKAVNVRLRSSKQLPGLADRYSKMADPTVKLYTNMNYRAAMVECTYQENGKTYLERLVTLIEDYGMNGGGLWKNRETMLVRAPAEDLTNWEPVLKVIQDSGNWNFNWIAGEVRGQQQRAGVIASTQKELQAIENAINENRKNTNSEINKDMYLTLTGQNEYANPFTGKIETDTDNWKNRWINSLGDIIYTNDRLYDPNRDPDLKISGFKLSVPRK